MVSEILLAGVFIFALMFIIDFSIEQEHQNERLALSEKANRLATCTTLNGEELFKGMVHRIKNLTPLGKDESPGFSITTEANTIINIHDANCTIETVRKA